MKLFIFIITTFFTIQIHAQSFKKLVCSPLDQTAVIEILFPKLINPLKPFIGFPEMWVQVTVEKNGVGWIYKRDKVLMIPERYPPSVDMRGQSSDALYIKLSPEIDGENYTGKYFGQLFVNDHESDHRAYFRFLDSNGRPGITCHSSL